MFKKMFLIAASAVAGIYLTSEEGKNARRVIQKKKTVIEPIIKNLIKQANDVIAGTKELDSDEVRVNLEKLVNEAKELLIKLDLDKTAETIKVAIKVASKKIRDASNELEKEKWTAKKKKIAKSSVKETNNSVSKTKKTNDSKLGDKKIVYPKRNR